MREAAGNKDWNDPSMTVDEFVNSYKTRYPNTSLSDADLRARYNDGYRLNPTTGRLARPDVALPPPQHSDLPTDPARVQAWADYRPGGNTLPCFPAGTLVHTPDGLAAIETLAPGATVMAWNLETRTVSPKPILRVFKNWTQVMVTITTDHGAIDTTRTHRFWTENRGWVHATELVAGDELLLRDGTRTAIRAVAHSAAEEATYNFEVAEDHTYFVADQGALVHNDDDDSAYLSRQARGVEIYEITDRSGRVVYVGQSVQGVDARLLEHINDPNSALYIPRNPGEPRITLDDPRNIYSTRRVAGGVWTPYEARVWEQHYIDRHGGIHRPPGPNDLLNRINAITPENFAYYRNLHNPC